MNAIGKALVAATAVVAVALACIGCGASANDVGVAQTPKPTATAAPSATAAPTPQPHADGSPRSNAAGPLVGRLLGARARPPLRAPEPRDQSRASRLPCRPAGRATRPWRQRTTGIPAQTGRSWFPQPFDHGFKNPCTDHTPVLPAAGSGAAGLLGVIAGQPGIKAGPITDVTVGGHAGKSVDYTVTTDPATCGNGQDGFWIWGTCPTPVTSGCEMVGVPETGATALALNSAERAYAIDVDGKTVTFFTKEPVDLSAADRAELQQVIDSMEFEPAG